MSFVFCHFLQTKRNYETLHLGLFRPVRRGCSVRLEMRLSLMSLIVIPHNVVILFCCYVLHCTDSCRKRIVRHVFLVQRKTCRAVSSVMRRVGSLTDAAGLFQTPYYTLKYCMNITETQDTLRS